MGTLDDAIREHLELKRRAGAGEDEVTRLENEAFGSARREPPAPAAADPEPPARDEPAAAGEPVAEEVPAPPPAASAEPAPAPADTWLEDEDDEPELPAATPAPPVEPVAGGSHAMTESDYVAPDEEGDDLLEETPEFLQETPEHDRLWFEQKPPRDFDFE